jgi:hypothetical protein
MTDIYTITEHDTPALPRDEMREIRADIRRMVGKGFVRVIKEGRKTIGWEFDDSSMDGVHESLLGAHGLYGFGYSLRPKQPAYDPVAEVRALKAKLADAS